MSFFHVDIYLCLAPKDTDFSWGHIQITAASTRSPTGTRCYSAGGKGSSTSSERHHFALVYTFTGAFSGPKTSVCLCACEPSLKLGDWTDTGAAAAPVGVGGWPCQQGLEVAQDSNTTGRRFIFPLNSAKVTVHHFSAFLPWTGGGFSRTVQVRWWRGNTVAQCRFWGARCPMSGMSAGASKLRCIIRPALSFWWWEACVTR